MRTIKAVLKGKFIVLQNDLEKSHTRDLIAHLKDLDRKKQTHSGGVDGRK